MEKIYFLVVYSKFSARKMLYMKLEILFTAGRFLNNWSGIVLSATFAINI